MPNTREKLMRLLCTANSKATEAEAFEDATYAQQLGIQADHLIANGVTVQEWISVKDRLPEHGQPVLVCDVREDYVGMAALQTAKRFVFSKSKDYWYWDRMECQIDEFTHWMPLPQPPKGE